MVSLRKPPSWALAGVVLALAVGALVFWYWVVERVEVPPGHFLVRIHLWGQDLEEGDILAPDESYKGILEEVKPEGRYFLNPFFWSYEKKEMVNVPNGKCLVLTRKFGRPLSAERLARGDFLAREGERGIVAKPLLPGKYRLNPYAYDWELVDAVEIRADQVGIHTRKVAHEADGDGTRREPAEAPKRNAPPRYVVREGERGVQEKAVSNGTYYINPHVEAIVPVDVHSHRVEFTDIEFPSRDGFTLKPHVLVTYRVLPVKAPELFVTLTDEGTLHQGDATPELQKKNEILQKVMLPLVRGHVRMEGSKFDAREFISASLNPQAGRGTNPRERLQQKLMEKVGPECQDVGIEVEAITLAQMDAPTELARQIAERELARVAREKNVDRIGQYKTEQELKATEALKHQEQEMVDAETRHIKAETLAKQNKAVEKARLEQDLANAKLKLEAAREQAKAVLAAGKAEADVINLQNDAEVSGLRKAVQGFPSAEYYAQYQVLTRLAPALVEIFAADTSEFGKLFSSYMAPPAGKGNAPAVPVTGNTTAAVPAPTK